MIEPFVPTIFRVAKDYYENTLLKDASLTPDERKTRLSSFVEQKMSGLLDLGPEGLAAARAGPHRVDHRGRDRREARSVAPRADFATDLGKPAWRCWMP